MRQKDYLKQRPLNCYSLAPPYSIRYCRYRRQYRGKSRRGLNKKAWESGGALMLFRIYHIEFVEQKA